MYLKQISIFVIIAGLIVGVWGGYDLYKIQSQRDSFLSANRSSPGELFGGAMDRINEMYARDRVADMNEEPAKIAIFGGVIFVIGLIMFGFSSKSQQTMHATEKVNHIEKTNSVKKVEEKTKVEKIAEIKLRKKAEAEKEAVWKKERDKEFNDNFLKY